METLLVVLLGVGGLGAVLGVCVFGYKSVMYQKALEEEKSLNWLGSGLTDTKECENDSWITSRKITRFKDLDIRVQLFPRGTTQSGCKLDRPYLLISNAGDCHAPVMEVYALPSKGLYVFHVRSGSGSEQHTIYDDRETWKETMRFLRTTFGDAEVCFE